MSATPALVQDYNDMTNLGLDLNNSSNVLDSRYRSRVTQRLSTINGSIGSSGTLMFNTMSLESQIVTYQNSVLELDFKIKPDAALAIAPDFPLIAVKSAIMSFITTATLRPADGGAIISTAGDPIGLANMLRLLDKDEDWLKCVGPSLHFAVDRTEDDVVGLDNLVRLNHPSASKFSAAPDVGVAADDKNNFSPAYNKGFAERRKFLQRACKNDVGVMNNNGDGSILNGYTFKARIPIRYLSDCMRALCDSGPVFGTSLIFEFTINNGKTCSPITLGGTYKPAVVGAGAAPETKTAAVGGGFTISIDTETPPVLTYDLLEMRPDVQAQWAERLKHNQLNRELMWREYNVQLNVADRIKGHNAQVNFTLDSAGMAVQRVWVLCYPKDVFTGVGWPSALVTGSNGLTDCELLINNKHYLQSVYKTAAEHYDSFLNATRLNGDGDRESIIPYHLYRSTSRIHCFDLSRSFSVMDPNAPVTIVLKGKVQIQDPDPLAQVEVVCVVESLRAATSTVAGNGKFTWTIGPKVYKP